MEAEMHFDTFKYFLECYFNMSADYEELEGLSKEFSVSEKDQRRLQLKAELEQIQSEYDWEHIREFIRKYGQRNPKDNDKLRWIIETIIKNLQ